MISLCLKNCFGWERFLLAVVAVAALFSPGGAAADGALRAPSAAADSITCRLGGQSVDFVLAQGEEEWDTIALRAQGKTPLQITEGEGFHFWPSRWPESTPDNLCPGALVFDAGEGRVFVVFLDDERASGYTLWTTLVDLATWRVLDRRQLGTAPLNRPMDPVDFRVLPDGFAVWLQVLAITDGDGRIDDWVTVRRELGTIQSGPEHEWRWLEKLLQDGLWNEGEQARHLTATPWAISSDQPDRRDRKAARSANDKGLAASHAHDPEAAEQWFAQGVAADPEDIELLNNLGYAQLQQGKREAAATLAAVIARAPRRVNAWVNLGQSFAAQNKPSLAAACFTLALRVSATPEKTLVFLQQLPGRDDQPGLHGALAALTVKPWVIALQQGRNAASGAGPQQDAPEVIAELAAMPVIGANKPALQDSMLLYYSTAPALEVIEFYKAELTRRGWAEQSRVDDDLDSALIHFVRGKELLFVSISNRRKSEEGATFVHLGALGFLRVQDLPEYPGATLISEQPVNRIVRTDDSIGTAAARIRQQLQEEEWQLEKDLRQSDMILFKGLRDSIELTVQVSVAPAQGHRTTIQYSLRRVQGQAP